MDDPRSVSGLQSADNLATQIEDAIDRQRPLRNQCVERLPIQQFHDEIRLALILTDVVDGANVRMIERRRRARFADEPADARGLQRRGR